MKKNGKNNFINIIQFIKTKNINLKQSFKSKLYSKYKINNNIFIIFYFFILCFSNLLSKKNFRLRQINSMNEIILTIPLNEGTNVNILYDYFNSLPNKVFINGSEYTPSDGQDFRTIYLDSGENSITLCYENVPNSLKNMFKDLSGITKIDLSNFDTSNVEDMSFMFNNCHDLKEINFNNFNTSSIQTMEGMFQNSGELFSLNLSSFDTSSVVKMRNMFYQCQKLKDLNILSFDISKVSDMVQMFAFCQTLVYIDISNFKSDININMGGMFKSCLHLESINFPENNKLKCSNIGAMFQDCRVLSSLDLSSLDTLNIKSMDYMFDNCRELTYINVSNFETSLVTTFENMFSNCIKLESLDLSNFITTSASNFANMFRSSNSLIYINLKSFTINNEANIINIFDNIGYYTRLCYGNNSSILSEKYNNINNDCNNICFSESHKLISELKICVEDCGLDNEYEYEYNNKCYKDKCPDGTVSSSLNHYLCTKILDCPKYSNMDKTECFDTIPEYYFISDDNPKLIDKCHDNCKSCNKKGTEDNNNCLTCKENLFYDNGNCVNNCIYGSYTDYSGNNICVCNNKCKECSNENNNLCKSCNQGYYPKKDDIINRYTFFDCYNPSEEVEGYYYYNNYFYPCYDSCKKCENEGNKNNHNCEECKDNYYKLLNESINDKNCYLNCNNNYYYFDSNNTYQCTTTKQCPSEQNKLIKDKNKCIDNCIKDDKYKNEYNNNECVKECPEGFFAENNICKHKETEIKTNEVVNENTSKETESIVGNWSSKDFFLGLYIADEKNTLSKDDIIKLIREDIINHNLDSMLENIIEEKEDKYIKEDNALYQITTTENQKNNIYTNISTIKLGECETILKSKYNINENETLILLKIDYNITGLLIPIIGYEVFHPKNKSKLNLAYCEESSINYNIPVSIDENNLFKYDQNSDYYNDECNTYTTENGTDIILDDRKKEFSDNNMSLCENICEYTGYDKENKKALCECGIRYKDFLISDINNQNDLLANNLTIDNTKSNIGALKCVETLFTKEGLITNIGSYILIIIIIIHLISIIIFYKCGIHIIETIIEDIIGEKQKLTKSEKKKKKKLYILMVKMLKNPKKHQIILY